MAVFTSGIVERLSNQRKKINWVEWKKNRWVQAESFRNLKEEIANT